MLEHIVFAIGLLGTALAGWQDFKTSEIEDKYAIFMGGSGLLIYFINSCITGVWSGFYYSVIAGIGLLLVGYIMFYANQWGEGDVLILGALGFLMPVPLSFFALNISFPLYPLLFLATVFIVGGIYSVLYSIVLALQTKGFFIRFLHKLESYFYLFVNISVFLFIFSVFAIRYVSDTMPYHMNLILHELVILYSFVLFGFIFISFARIIDSFVFRRQINTADMKEGDVLAEDVFTDESKSSRRLKGNRFVGLNADDIRNIRRLREKVWIKEGVRFAPSFFFSLVFMYLFGNIFVFLLF